MTDPAINSASKEFGGDDLSYQGFAGFCDKHQCNSICKLLHLEPLDRVEIQAKLSEEDDMGGDPLDDPMGGGAGQEQWAEVKFDHKNDVVMRKCDNMLCNKLMKDHEHQLSGFCQTCQEYTNKQFKSICTSCQKEFNVNKYVYIFNGLKEPQMCQSCLRNMMQ